MAGILCQVTRAAWAGTPLALWIKANLDQRGWLKKDLIGAVAKERGIRWEAAERAVYRWTTPPGKDAEDESLAALAAIFEEAPPGMSTPDRYDEMLAQILARLDGLAADMARTDLLLASLRDRLGPEAPPAEADSGDAGSRTRSRSRRG